MLVNKSFKYLNLSGGNIAKFTTAICHYAVSRRAPPYSHPNPINKPRPTAHSFRAKYPVAGWKKERAKKVIKVELPNFYKDRPDEMTPAQQREKMKERGIQPHRPWNERVIYLASTGGTFEPYVPPEGDGKAAFVSAEGAKQSYKLLTTKGKSMLAIRKIRKYEEEFSSKRFLVEAEKIYIDLHNALAKGDGDLVQKYATEKIFPIVMHEAKYKTIHWSFLSSLEPPRVVHIRQTNLLTDDNIFAQITTRFHTQQLLAVYDRFGRLIHGSEVVARDVLEYVVFEKNISNTYGVWRVHDKIIPDWMKLRPTSFRTFREPPPPPESPEEDMKDAEDTKDQEKVSSSS